MRGRPVAPNAEPGTGTQVHHYASDPQDEDNPNSYRINGEKWKCGREYWDSRSQDLVTLTRVIGRSSWCDTREPDECPPKLVFERDPAPDVYNSHFMADPNDPDNPPEERFTIRRIPDPAGVEGEVW